MTQQLEMVFAARDEGLARVEANASDQDRNVIDQAILTFARTGMPFSANDFRDLLPEVRNRKLIGQRLAALAQRRPAPYVKVGEVVSTDVGTHGKKIGLYRLYDLYGNPGEQM